MPSKKKKVPKKDVKTIGKTERDIDKTINDILNAVDSAFMDKHFDDVVALVYYKGRFNDGEEAKIKTVMGLRKSDKNISETSETLIFMFMFLCKKLNFREEAAKNFIAEQILAVNPEAKDVSEALDQLLDPNSP